MAVEQLLEELDEFKRRSGLPRRAAKQCGIYASFPAVELTWTVFLIVRTSGKLPISTPANHKRPWPCRQRHHGNLPAGNFRNGIESAKQEKKQNRTFAFQEKNTP